MNDTHVAALLDELTPRYDDRRGDWERVAVDARAQKPPAPRPAAARRWPARIAAVVVAAAAIAGVALAWPFQSGQPGLLDRALAAVGEGPVLHVVLRGEWGGTLIDLTSGERKPVYGDNEIWFDTETGRTHQIERLGGVVQGEELYTPKKPAAVLAALGHEYRRALELGTARVAGEGTIDGAAVVWIIIHSELLPDVGDRKDHEWAQQIAVSKQSYEPVAVRETRDGRPGPGTLQRVLELKLVARSAADFTTSRRSLDGTAFKRGREPIALAQAAAVLGRTPLWLGRDYDGLPLAQVYRETTSVGHQRRVRLRGAKAAAAMKCSQQRERAGDCFRALGLTSVAVGPDGVFTIDGPIEWRDEQTSVVFFYGRVGDDSGTYLEDGVPLADKRYVIVTESLHPSPFRRGAAGYVPSQGSVFIAAGGQSGFLQRDGVHIVIAGASEGAIVAAARALTSMPR
jgi:hypothetical protein